jgi:uncharacterized protein YidB (DUF937 family)
LAASPGPSTAAGIAERQAVTADDREGDAQARLRDRVRALPQHHQDVLRAFLDWLDHEGKDIQWLLDRFEAHGFGEHVASWVGAGENRTLSAAEVDAALGSKHTSRIARQAGHPKSLTSEILGTVVPILIDSLTPKGKVPHRSILAEGIQFVADLLLAA